MKSNLIIYTPRSGSMLLGEIISFHTKTKNIREGWIVDRTQPDVSRISHNAFLSSDTNVLLKFLNEHTKRRELLKRLIKSRAWTAKMHVTHSLTNSKTFLEECLENPNVNVWMTHRVNIVNQFLSLINAGYRQAVLKGEGGDFIFSNHTKVPVYDVIDFPRHQIFNTLITFIYQLVMWRNVYDMYGDRVKLVNYEKHIKPLDLEGFGIGKDVIDGYFMTENHLIPTPITIDKFSIPGIWDDCVEILNQHQHLVEI
jgi:hypothetical protein